MAGIEDGEMVLASAISNVIGVREEGVMGECKEEFSEAGEASLEGVIIGELAVLIGADIGLLRETEVMGVAGTELTCKRNSRYRNCWYRPGRRSMRR